MKHKAVRRALTKGELKGELKKMSETEKIRKECDDRIKTLQKTCPHEKLSKWCDEWWALGHSSGFHVKYCLRCEKTIRRRTTCRKCGKLTEAYVGGGIGRWPIGEYRCRECSRK